MTVTATRKAAAELPVKAFRGQAQWAAWLGKNHLRAPGVWLKLAKKGSGKPSVSYAEAVETALCHGWIDGQARRLDDAWWVQKFVPRGPRSIWSKINRAKALALIESGQMKPAGLEAVERAKKNGQWENAYASASTATVPPDLRAALAANPKASAFFAALDGANRYAVLFRVTTAKQPATRARRIENLVSMLARKGKLHP